MSIPVKTEFVLPTGKTLIVHEADIVLDVDQVVFIHEKPYTITGKVFALGVHQGGETFMLAGATRTYTLQEGT